jgi:hypothetical protein
VEIGLRGQANQRPGTAYGPGTRFARTAVAPLSTSKPGQRCYEGNGANREGLRGEHVPLLALNQAEEGAAVRCGHEHGNARAIGRGALRDQRPGAGSGHAGRPYERKRHRRYRPGELQVPLGPLLPIGPDLGQDQCVAAEIIAPLDLPAVFPAPSTASSTSSGRGSPSSWITKPPLPNANRNSPAWVLWPSNCSDRAVAPC